jgi:hypothetical protein
MNWAMLLKLDFDTDPAYLWSGLGSLSWGGHTWTGIGDLGSISNVGENSALKDSAIKATFNHMSSDLVDAVTTMDPVGRPFELHLALFTDDNQLEDVITLTSGFIDAVELVDGDTGHISMDLVSEAALLGRLTAFRLDDQHQQNFFPGDLGLEFVTSLDEEILWGHHKASVGGGGGGSRSGMTRAGEFTELH